ncbi:hypothetical protein ACP275_14G323900 [Erythranthe tilingii]
MVEGKEGAGPDSMPGSNSGSLFESSGDRVRFTVELRPGETTIVSWKKLLREANSSKSRPGTSVSDPSAEAQFQPVSQPARSPPLEAPSSSKQPLENEPKDSQGQAGPNRLSNVIERIERMYAGNGSGDEEDVVLDNVPDDDEYDTEDSFIDDAELDDYFQIDNSSIKHDGFFVNRGKLEGIEPTIPTNQQPKKRRREDLTKGHGGSDDGHNPNKNVKIGNKVRKTSSSQRNSGSQSHKGAIPNIHGENMQFQASPMHTAEVSLKNKAAESQTTRNPSGLLNGDAVRQDMATDQQRSVVLSLKSHVSKLKETELQNTSTQRSNNKNSLASKSRFGKQKNNVDGLDQSIQQKGKGGLIERFDLNVPAMGDSTSSTAALMQRKEAASVRSKSTTLEKAIRELEKIVSEFRPPSTEVKDPDNSSQAVKRRLPPVIKQKLGKVGRLAQISYGKIPKEVINHLMSIVGHLMQIRTLKRNLNVTSDTGLSAKQDKDDIIKKMKQEVAEMVKLKIVSIKSKVEQQAANSDDFQEAGPEEKEALKRKYIMDDLLENKICDLYDLYVERSETNSGPSVRRLYEELVVLWPNGSMDIDGIKRAIYRAKDRRGLCSMRKDQEKTKRKLSAPKAKDATQTLHIHEKLSSDPRQKGSTSTSKPIISAAAAAHNTARVPISSANDPKMEKPKKKEKLKGISNSNPVDTTPSNALPNKKIKRNPNPAVSVEPQFRLEKMASSKAEERPKPRKHNMSAPLTKSNNLQPAVPSGS